MSSTRPAFDSSQNRTSNQKKTLFKDATHETQLPKRENSSERNNYKLKSPKVAAVSNSFWYKKKIKHPTYSPLPIPNLKNWKTSLTPLFTHTYRTTKSKTIKAPLQKPNAYSKLNTNRILKDLLKIFPTPSTSTHIKIHQATRKEFSLIPTYFKNSIYITKSLLIFSEEKRSKKECSFRWLFSSRKCRRGGMWRVNFFFDGDRKGGRGWNKQGISESREVREGGFSWYSSEFLTSIKKCIFLHCPFLRASYLSLFSSNSFTPISPSQSFYLSKKNLFCLGMR